MAANRCFITTHSVAVYFALAFAISWAGVLLVIGGPSGIPGTAAQTNPLFPWVYLAMLLGPSVAGSGMTALVYRSAGLRQFRSRVLNWRVGARWYAFALLTAPVLVTAILLAIQGSVWLEIVVTREGIVRSVRVLHSLDPSGLDEEAVKTIRAWQFEPGRLSGRPVDVVATVAMDFSIW